MIDFIIPAYGQSAYLKNCIESIKSQSIPCSIKVTTSTPNAHIERTCSDYGIPLKINLLRESIASDWNFALASAENNIIVLAHQDDWYHPQYADVIEKYFLDNSDASIVFTDGIEFDTHASKRLYKREFFKLAIRWAAFLGGNKINKPSQYFRLLAFGCPIPCASVAFNSINLGNLRFSKDFSVNLDWDFWCRLVKAGGVIGYCNKPYYFHRIHDEAETQKALVDFRRHDEDALIFSRFWPPFMVKLMHFLYKYGY